jgi:GH15 family glucan-1,4-alpha-glucosidase
LLQEPLSSGVFPRIDDYGAIGDCRAVALVSSAGSIEWLCWPRFDSPSLFASILDREQGGYWRISPRTSRTSARRYIEHSNVLETKFRTEHGTGVLTDLMPVRDAESGIGEMVPDHEIVRQFSCTSGELELEFELVPRPRYGSVVPAIRNFGNLGWRIDAGRGVCWIRSSIPLRFKDGVAHACAHMRAGESAAFSLSYTENAPAVLPPLDQVPHRIETCVGWWTRWVSQMRYDGEFKEEVIRSALALKLMTFAPSGAIIAAPTTSLPEKIGGGLNWDYRYCWLRDASMTIRAMIELGYWQEASAFLDWMLHATRLTQPELHILYTVFGNRAPREWKSGLRGYRGSSPVRIGNAARDQLQLDVYGEVIDAAAQYAFHGGNLDLAMQKALAGFGDYVLGHWQLPDEGIWEPRTGRTHHTHSRLLCWTSLDRLLTLHAQGKLRGINVDQYKKQRDLIGDQIRRRGWNEKMQSYVSELDGDKLDSSLLLLSWYGFEKPDSQRMRSTYAALRNRLATRKGLLYRSESLPPEGTFAICSFWEAEYLALGGGTISQTRDLLQTLATYQNDLGLYGEEISEETGEALGNFPQAFTHVGLIGAVLSLDQRQKGEQQLAHRRESANAGQSHPTAA